MGRKKKKSKGGLGSGQSPSPTSSAAPSVIAARLAGIKLSDLEDFANNDCLEDFSDSGSSDFSDFDGGVDGGGHGDSAPRVDKHAATKVPPGPKGGGGIVTKASVPKKGGGKKKAAASPAPLPRARQKKSDPPRKVEETIILRVRPFAQAGANKTATDNSGPSRNVANARTVHLCPEDAAAVDVLDGERALIFDVGSDGRPRRRRERGGTSFAAVCSVRVAQGGSVTPTGGAGTGGRNRRNQQVAVPIGTARLAPPSLADELFRSEEDDDTSGTADTDSKPRQAAVPATPTPTAATSPSPSKSKFSFARGGGGDLLISPPSGATRRTTPSTPTSSSRYDRRRGGDVRIAVVPLDARLVDALRRRGLCPHASELILVPSSPSTLPNDTIEGSGLLLRRMVHAACADVYVERGDMLTISFRGRKVLLSVKSVVASGVKEDGGGVAVDSHVLPEILRNLNFEDPPIILHRIVPSTHVEVVPLWRERERTSDDDGKAAVLSSDPVGALTSRMNALMISAPRAIPTMKFIAGLDATVRHVRSLLLPALLRPELFPRTGSIHAPRGVLLHGPGGVGKSALAEQIGRDLRNMMTSPRRNDGDPNESGNNERIRREIAVQNVSCAGIQAATSVVGEAERQLARIFDAAEQVAERNGVSTLLILDDVHLICPRRGSPGGGGGGSDRVAGTLLALMDGIGSSEGAVWKGGRGGDQEAKRTTAPGNVVVLAVTSNPSLLDPALRRPGRLDAEVEVPIPDDVARADILRLHADRMRHAGVSMPPLGPTELRDLAGLAKGFTGADCALCIKEAVRQAVLRAHHNGTKGIVGGEGMDVGLWITIEDLRRAVRSTKPSTIRSVAVEVPRVPWSSIGGMDHVKSSLREAIELPLTHPHLFEALCVPPPRGVLLYGPPGCSKTLMARALATEGRMNFLAVKGPELLSKWLGESERALASLFRRARMASPCVVFFDEIDSIASRRGGGSGGGERLLSQLLTELDGVGTPRGSVGPASANKGGDGSEKKRIPRLVVVGATNRPDLLDPALTRPGRIDRMIYVGLPDQASREMILKIGLKGKDCHGDINVSELAAEEITGGFSGAELIAICREAALYAIEEESDDIKGEAPKIGMRHLLQSLKGMKRQITPEMLHFYDTYRNTANH